MQKPMPEDHSEPWVVRWIDYTSKYGMGYILSNGLLGILFNDSTKIILSPSGQHFDYINRRSSDRVEVQSTHTLSEFPEDLTKKVTLVRHFKSYLLSQNAEKKESAYLGESGFGEPVRHCQPLFLPGEAPYVKKWSRTKHAAIFMFSNKVVQVVFNDKTEILMTSRQQSCTYLDKRGESATYPVESPSAELSKRLKYLKDAMSSLMNGSQRPAAPTTASCGGA